MSQYKPGRSTRVYKIKKYFDEEGRVIGVKDCRNNEDDCAKLILRDKKGFQVTIRMGTMAERQSWLARPSSVIGKKVIFRHSGRHPTTNVAQQPTGVTFRDYE